MPRLPDPGPLPRMFGPYQLIRRIAVGGMAEVYVALARGVSGFEKLVAIKLIHPGHSEDPQFVDMLVDEAKLSVLLTHAHIAQTFDLGSVDGRFFIVMEYVDGADASKLLDALARHRALLPIPAAMLIVNRVAQALDYAHRKADPFGESLHVIHRDVSPQNVLLGRDGDVKLTDFGIAKAALRTNQTEVGVIKGKYCYMSPEQAWADPIDQRSDVFSAGAVLFELLTGRMLFSPDDNLPALLERVRKAEITRPSVFREDVPPSVDDIVLRALARNPDDRFESAADLAFELERELWRIDRTFGPSKLAKLMASYFPLDGTFEVDDERTGRTAVTKIEGTHTKMESLEFVPESGTSVLFGEQAEAMERARSSRPSRPTSRPGRPATLKDLVEALPKGPPDPRAEPASVLPGDDDEDEVTTFFAKVDLGEFEPPRASDARLDRLDRVDEDATLVDHSGELAKQLEAMVAPAAPPRAALSESILVRELDATTIPAKRRSFRPPAPLWKPLPFVGPPLEPEDLPVAVTTVRQRGVFVPLPILLAAGVGLAVVAMAIVYALL